MSQLVRWEGKHTTQRAHCALVSQPISQLVCDKSRQWMDFDKNVDEKC